MFDRLYTSTMNWVKHPKAPWFLSGLSFAESSFFPIPPDVMLAPMALGQPDKAWRFAALTTLFSVLGGVLGYGIGLFLFDAVEPLLHRFGYYEGYLNARDWFDRWGFWAVFLAGFSPIPYKVFTISAGAVAMAMAPFVLASLVGRGARFFLVAGLMRWGGEAMETRIRRHVNLLGWATVALVVALYLILRH
jgi:membrane protein YqaA with SNARE-associated domain